MAWGDATQGNQGGSTETPSPPARRYRAKLATVADVNREIQRIYREARSALIPVDHASKYANILSIIARIHESSDLEARIAALESGPKK